MKIEKLNENKIRITLNIEDLKNKNVDFHSFMSNPIESQSLFLEMLDEAEKEVGFTTENYRISIEALAMSNGTFIFTVTRVQENNIQENKDIHIKRKENTNNTNILIYEFEEFDDFIEFCRYFENSIIGSEKEIHKNNSLYLYNNKYYLILKSTNKDSLLINVFNSMIMEFANPVTKSVVFEGKLREFGKLVIKTAAIKTAIKCF